LAASRRQRQAGRTGLTPQQCQAARELLGWTPTQLADAVAMSRATVTLFEKGARKMAVSNQQAIRIALEQAGVKIDAADGPRLA